jgi:imidazolonepropionase-like amidohydrolase
MNGTVIPATGQEPTVANVLLEDGRIVDIGTNVRPHGNAVEIDASGMYLMPGMIDSHVHMAMNGGVESSTSVETTDAYAVLRAARDMARTLGAGFTTVRDLGGRNGMEFALRDAIRDGVVPGPRLLLAGSLISMTTSGPLMYPGMYYVADGCDEVRRAARTQLARGADVVKVFATGAAFCEGEDPRWTQLDEDEIRVAVQEAHKQGKPAAAHAEGVEGIRNAVVAGIDTIEHGDFLCEDDETIELMRSRGTILTPTMLLYDTVLQHLDDEAIPAFVRQNCEWIAPINRRSVQTARDAGIPIALGTDAGPPYHHHGGNARELALLASAGLTNEEVLESATRVAARAVGKADELGTLEVGKCADVLVLGGNPLDDLDVLIEPASFQWILLGGRIVGGTAAERARTLHWLTTA